MTSMDRRTYLREYQKRWIAARRAEYMKDKQCVVCGSTENLELDHIDPKTKVVAIAAVWSMARNNPKRIVELSKCQALCETHHLEKTLSERPKASGKHGRSMYKRGCRCEICKKDKSLENSERYF